MYSPRKYELKLKISAISPRLELDVDAKKLINDMEKLVVTEYGKILMNVNVQVFVECESEVNEYMAALEYKKVN